MPTETLTERERALADWQKLADDESALVLEPDAYHRRLIDLAHEARRLEVIDAEDLRELLELADAAYAWAVEERITRGLDDA
jgi:poly(3-hydroxybutyrate) depolymerase